jgi:large subunit ribosomal protein L28
MARRCELTGKGVMSGHLVSHSNIKTKRRFLPNLQVVRFISDKLGGRTFSLKVSANAIRTVEHNGGLDNFLLTTPDRKLPAPARAVKKLLEQQQASTPAA